MLRLYCTWERICSHGELHSARVTFWGTLELLGEEKGWWKAMLAVTFRQTIHINLRMGEQEITEFLEYKQMPCIAPTVSFTWLFCPSAMIRLLVPLSSTRFTARFKYRVLSFRRYPVSQSSPVTSASFSRQSWKTLIPRLYTALASIKLPVLQACTVHRLRGKR